MKKRQLPANHLVPATKQLDVVELARVEGGSFDTWKFGNKVAVDDWRDSH